MRQDENELLTRVGPGTPCGETLRRYWWPVATSESVKDKPVTVRVLGEDLILFRDGAGVVGLLDRTCCHRGASLEYGRVERQGLRCSYHGWLWDVNGKCLQQPMEPKSSTFKDKVRQTAYVARDVGGLVFAYMGPKPVPLFPQYDLLFRDKGRRAVWGRDVHNNWLQAVENPVDPYHVMVTHASIYPELALTRPEMTYTQTSYGIQMDLVDRSNGFAERYHHVFPGAVRVNVQRVGQESCHYLIWQTPRDDVSTVGWFAWASESEQPPHQLTTGPYQKTVPGDWRRVEDGWFGLWERDQDDAVISSQGRIADRTKEHLGTSDAGVILYRKMLKRAIAEVKKGKDPLGVIRDKKKDVPIAFDTWKRGLGAEAGQIRKPDKAKELEIIAPYE
jgi:5,5'-dehydrodivanillate O-demethylase oxygenase subunit